MKILDNKEDRGLDYLLLESLLRYAPKEHHKYLTERCIAMHRELCESEIQQAAQDKLERKRKIGLKRIK